VFTVIYSDFSLFMPVRRRDDDTSSIHMESNRGVLVIDCSVSTPQRIKINEVHVDFAHQILEIVLANAWKQY